MNRTIYHYAPIISLPVAKGSIPAVVNLTITVLEPLSSLEQFNENFKGFWTIYGQPIGIILGGFAGISLIFDRLKKRFRKGDQANVTDIGLDNHFKEQSEDKETSDP